MDSTTQVEAGFPRIHGFVYDVGEGLLRKLDIDFKSEVKK
jgi:carbonic anhydrase